MLEILQHPFAILAVAIGVVFVLIIALRINAFIALITAATVVGVLSASIPFAQVMGKVAGHFGEMCAKIGIVIALAALIGQCMMESGAADKIVRV
ncbi:MAG: gluconate permease, partial [bacterium]|nr:gluconate permease [bacterium]